MSPVFIVTRVHCLPLPAQCVCHHFTMTLHLLLVLSPVLGLLVLLPCLSSHVASQFSIVASQTMTGQTNCSEECKFWIRKSTNQVCCHRWKVKTHINTIFLLQLFYLTENISNMLWNVHQFTKAHQCLIHCLTTSHINVTHNLKEALIEKDKVHACYLPTSQSLPLGIKQ